MAKAICPVCNKEMTLKDELEYSEEYSKLYCSPDCATTDYFEKAKSIRIEGNFWKKKYLSTFIEVEE